MYQLIDAVEKPMRTLCVASPRKILFATCLLMFLSTLFMSGFNVWLCFFFYDETYSYEWASFLGLAIVGACLGVICILGMRGAHIVTLDLLLLYFWLTCVLVAPLAMAQAQCAAPLQGGRFFNSTAYWCLEYYGETTCQSIRDGAVAQALNWGSLAIYRILTSTVITQSMNDIMNVLLLMPTLACGLVARNMWWMRKYNIPFYFLADLFLCFCGAQVAMLPLGVLAGRMKSQRIMAVYIFLSTLQVLGLALLGSGCIFVAGLIILPQNYTINDATRDTIACINMYTGCCCCKTPNELSGDRCPEWSQADTIANLSITFKNSGVIAFLCLSYHVGALTVSGMVHQNLKDYKTDYI